MCFVVKVLRNLVPLSIQMSIIGAWDQGAIKVICQGFLQELGIYCIEFVYLLQSDILKVLDWFGCMTEYLVDLEG